MRKYYYYFLLLILNISFLQAQDNLAETFSEEQNEAIEALTDEALAENITEKPSITDEAIKTDEITDNLDKTAEKITILRSDSFTPPPSFSNKPAFSKERPDTNIKNFGKNPNLAASLSAIPGLGHVYLGEYATAGYIFGAFVIGIGGQLNEHTAFPGSITSNAAISYGIYSAYRDARLSIKDRGYAYKMPTDSFKELSLAAFNLKVLKKPEVWGGFLGSFTTIVAISVLHEKLNPEKEEKNSSVKNQCKVAVEDAHPLMAFVVGISEESLFRGFLQSFLSETYTPAGGIVLSSLAFGAAHIYNAQGFSKEERKEYYIYTLPFITAFGAYAGWITYKNQSLQESVALHSWYDFTLLVLKGVVEHSAIIKKPGFSFSFSF